MPENWYASGALARFGMGRWIVVPLSVSSIHVLTMSLTTVTAVGSADDVEVVVCMDFFSDELVRRVPRGGFFAFICGLSI